jgi:predicted amidophosphoribosyltransferase
MEFCCPHCNAPIYSRKQKICGVCEKSLPPELLLSDKQIEVLKKQEGQMEKRTKEFDQSIRYIGDSGGV